MISLRSVFANHKYFMRLKREQAAYIERSMSTMGISPRDDLNEFSSKADRILNDATCPVGVNYRDLALAARIRYPEMAGKILDWVEPKSWKEYWESEGFVKPRDGSLNTGHMDLKIGLDSPSRRYRHFRRLVPPEATRIVELGSGISPILFHWAKQGVQYYAVGLDYQKDVVTTGGMAISQYKERVPGEVRFVQGNIFDLTGQADLKDGTFDVCYNYGLLEHFQSEKQKMILEQMVRLTKPGGMVIVAVPNFSSPSIMLRRWLIHGVARRHEPESRVNLWWPFGYEQPMKERELTGLFKAHGALEDIKQSGISPFHDFQLENVWKYKRLFARRSWYLPDNDYGLRKASMIETLLGKCSDNTLLNGDYRWYVPVYAPVLDMIARAANLVIGTDGMNIEAKAKANELGSWVSNNFGNLIVVSAIKK